VEFRQKDDPVQHLQGAAHEDGILDGVGVVGGAAGGLGEADGTVESLSGVVGLANFEEDFGARAGAQRYLKGREEPCGDTLALELRGNRDGFELRLRREDRGDDESGKAMAGSPRHDGDALQ